MQDLDKALDEVKSLYEKLLGKPAPEIGADVRAAFPPGVDPVAYALYEVEHLKQLSERLAYAPVPTAWVPTADSFATDDAFVVRMEIPGAAREDLKVLVIGGECVVRGERKPPEAVAGTRPLTLERLWGPFERRFLLPAGAHPDRVTAKYSEGLLELRVAVQPGAVPKETIVEAA